MLFVFKRLIKMVIIKGFIKVESSDFKFNIDIVVFLFFGVKEGINVVRGI